MTTFYNLPLNIQALFLPKNVNVEQKLSNHNIYLLALAKANINSIKRANVNYAKKIGYPNPTKILESNYLLSLTKDNTKSRNHENATKKLATSKYLTSKNILRLYNIDPRTNFHALFNASNNTVPLNKIRIHRFAYYKRNPDAFLSSMQKLLIGTAGSLSNMKKQKHKWLKYIDETEKYKFIRKKLQNLTKSRNPLRKKTKLHRSPTDEELKEILRRMNRLDFSYIG